MKGSAKRSAVIKGSRFNCSVAIRELLRKYPKASNSRLWELCVERGMAPDAVSRGGFNVSCSLNRKRLGLSKTYAERDADGSKVAKAAKAASVVWASAGPPPSFTSCSEPVSAAELHNRLLRASELLDACGLDPVLAGDCLNFVLQIRGAGGSVSG